MRKVENSSQAKSSKVFRMRQGVQNTTKWRLPKWHCFTNIGCICQQATNERKRNDFEVSKAVAKISENMWSLYFCTHFFGGFAVNVSTKVAYNRAPLILSWQLNFRGSMDTWIRGVTSCSQLTEIPFNRTCTSFEDIRLFCLELCTPVPRCLSLVEWSSSLVSHTRYS